MADQRISALSALLQADVQATTDVLPIADISTAETKKVTPAALVAAGIVGVGPGTINGSVIQTGTITGAQIAANTVTASKLANGAVGTAAIVDGAVTGVKIAADSITAVQIGPNAVGASELANDAVDTSAIQDAAVTSAKLATGSVGTAQLAAGAVDSSKLASGSVTNAAIGALAVDTTQLANGSVTAPKLATGAVTSTALASGAVLSTAIADGAVTGAKIAADTITAAQIGPNAIGHSELANGAVDTPAIQDLSVTTPKLAIGAVGTAQIAAGAVGTAQLADGGVTTTKVADGAIVTAKIDDGAVTAAKLAGGAVGSTALDDNSVTTTKVADGAITAAKLANDLDGSEFLPQGSKAVLIGPGAGGAAVPSFRLLVPTDIPKLEAANLPVATPTALGAVKVGSGLTADGSGVLGIANTVVGGTSSKVTFNAQGLITAAASLSADDIPSISAGKLTTGTLDVARLPDGQITGQKLANYATTLIQEAEPAGTDHYTGQFWYRESDAQLRTWSGNSWIPVGFGRLSEENLRFCGTFDASTGLIQNVTTFGTTAGLTTGVGIPAAAETLTGVYLVAVTPGVYNGDTYDNGDWVLCIGTSWIRVDTLSSAGGGATVKLGDLLDVTITTPQSGDSLIFDATTSTWKNRTTHGVKISLTEPFDGARTSFTTSRAIVSENNLLVSVGGVIQEPGIDFTAVAGGLTINFTAPPPAGSDHWILQEASVDGGGGGGGGGGASLPPGTAAEEYLQWNSTLSAWQPSTVLTGGSY